MTLHTVPSPDFSISRQPVRSVLRRISHLRSSLRQTATASRRNINLRKLSLYVLITEAPVRGGVGNPPGLTVSVDPGHTGPRVSPDPGPTPGTADGE